MRSIFGLINSITFIIFVKILIILQIIFTSPKKIVIDQY